jgi:hypothetical protein
LADLGDCADDPDRLRLFDEFFERLAVQFGLALVEERIENNTLLIRMWRKEARLRDAELDAGNVNAARWQVAPGLMLRASRELDALTERRAQLYADLAAAAREAVRRHFQSAPRFTSPFAQPERAQAMARTQQDIDQPPKTPPNPPDSTAGAVMPELAAAHPGGA